MAKWKKKIIKEYLKYLSKEGKRDFKSCLKNSEDKNISGKDEIFYSFILKYSKYHPLDFFAFAKKYLFKETKYSQNNEFLLSLLDERLETTKGNVCLKRYVGYIFEWQTFFSDTNTKTLNETDENSLTDLQSLRSLFESLLVDGMLEKLNFEISKKIKYSNFHKDQFYNNLYIAFYHQEETQRPLFSRLLSIYSLLGKKYIKDLQTLKKYLLIFAGMLYYTNTEGIFFIELNKLLSTYLQKTIISRQDILDFLKFIGVEKYSQYISNVKNKKHKDYFLGKTEFDFINIELEIHKTPFIDVSDEVGKTDFYIFDETFLLKQFYSRLGNFTIEEESNKKMTFGDLIEKYILTFVEEWLKYEGSKLDKNNYIVKQGIKFKVNGNIDGEIDLLIYNKITKNLIIFEAKDFKILNENLFKVQNMEQLCKKEVEREINGKIRKEPGDVYKGITQLLKHSQRKKEDIAKSFGVDEIKEIKYIFLTHHNTIWWNEIMRHFIDKNKEFQGLDYQFMNLAEFEMLISLGCKKGIDFFELIKEKSEKVEIDDRFKVILEEIVKNVSSNPKGFNQNFKAFFHKVYGYKGENIAPFIPTSLLKEFFKEDN